MSAFFDQERQTEIGIFDVLGSKIWSFAGIQQQEVTSKSYFEFEACNSIIPKAEEISTYAWRRGRRAIFWQNIQDTCERSAVS